MVSAVFMAASGETYLVYRKRFNTRSLSPSLSRAFAFCRSYGFLDFLNIDGAVITIQASGFVSLFSVLCTTFDTELFAFVSVCFEHCSSKYFTAFNLILLCASQDEVNRMPGRVKDVKLRVQVLSLRHRFRYLLRQQQQRLLSLPPPLWLLAKHRQWHRLVMTN